MGSFLWKTVISQSANLIIYSGITAESRKVKKNIYRVRGLENKREKTAKYKFVLWRKREVLT